MRELTVTTERKTQLLDVTDRVRAALEGKEGSLLWGHVHVGDPNPWSPVRAALTGSSISIPFENGHLALCGHQAILAEFDGPRERTLLLTLTR